MILNKLNPTQKIVSVLMYHGLENDPVRLAANPLDTSPESCLAEIRFFQEQGYTLISASELGNLAERNDDNQAYLLISFDDAHLNTYDYLYRWINEEEIPILLAVCPGIIEGKKIFWWEEARARFDLARTETIELKVEGRTICYTRQDIDCFEEKCRNLPHQQLLVLLEELRRQTKYIHEEQLRLSKFVHENMNWDHVRSLAESPLCTLACHSLEHEIAIRLSTDQLLKNAKLCKSLITKNSCVVSDLYVYPNGIGSDVTDRVLKTGGFSHTFSCQGGTNSVIDMPVRLKRFTGMGYQPENTNEYAYSWNERHALAL